MIYEIPKVVKNTCFCLKLYKISFDWPKCYIYMVYHFLTFGEQSSDFDDNVIKKSVDILKHDKII